MLSASSFAINIGETQHVPHITISSEQMLNTIRGIKAISSSNKGSSTSSPSNREERKSNARKPSFEPQNKTSRSHEEWSHYRSPPEVSYSPTLHHNPIRHARSRSLDRSKSPRQTRRPRPRRYTDVRYNEEFGYVQRDNMPWHSSHRGR